MEALPRKLHVLDVQRDELGAPERPREAQEQERPVPRPQEARGERLQHRAQVGDQERGLLLLSDA